MDKYRFVGIIKQSNDVRLEGRKLYIPKADFKGEILNITLDVKYTRVGNIYILNGREIGGVKFENV